MALMKKIVFAVTAAGMLLAVFFETVQAQESHSGHDMGAMTMTSDNPSTQGYMDAMKKMDDDMMAMNYSGDADVDFVKGMIPHHQGAIDMAKVVLEHGKDPEIRKLAEDVIAAQEAEIREMQDWLKAHAEK